MKLLQILSLLIITLYGVKSQFSQCTWEETCKPFKDCDELKSMTEKGFLTPQERSYLLSKQCKSINRVPYVCCSVTRETTSPPPPINVKSKFPKAPACGISLHDRIVGGESTAIDEHPWIAQLQYRKPENKIGSHCGGSLINERWVITAAHCHKKVPRTWTLFQVRLGDWDTRSDPDCQDLVNEQVCNDPYVEIPISQIIVHEEYLPDSKKQHHDIALLKLQRDARFTDFIKPVCLPTEMNLRSLDYTGQALEVVGFGKTENSNSSPRKLKVDIDAYSFEACESKYQSLGIIRGQLCAGGEPGKDSCNGDSGGPLLKSKVYPNSVTPYYMLIGLVSFGPKNCGTKDQPGVYTKVSEYMPWIESHVK